MTAEEPLVTADSLIAEFGEDEAYSRGVAIACVAVRLRDDRYGRQLGLALQELTRRGLHKKRAQP